MFLPSVNKSKQLLLLSFIANVRVDELAKSHNEVAMMIADLEPGFRSLNDLSRLDSMDVDCGAEIGKIMELCDHKGVGMIVRVIPDPTKDIGLGILTNFHYSHRPRVATCDTMAEAAKILSL